MLWNHFLFVPLPLRQKGFNPCFSGLCFGTQRENNVVHPLDVLILVLVDYALEPINPSILFNMVECFNPCFSGLCFGTSS